MTRIWLTFGDDDWQTGFAELGALPWYGLEISDRPHGMAVCFGEAEDGRLVCIGLLIDPRKNVEVSTRLLREIPLGAIVQRASTGPPVERPASTRYRIRKPRPGPTGLPVKHYERVAKAYRLALRTHPRTPVRRLMAQMGNISESTAHRYLAKCRELGLLDSRTTKGKES